MQFPAAVLPRIAAGTVTTAYRRWERPRVRVGGTQRTAIGVLEFTAVDELDAAAEAALTELDAHAAGYPDTAALRHAQDPTRPGRRQGRLYRITIALAGPDPRVALRERSAMSTSERAELAARLHRLDTASRRGPWTDRVLTLIAEHPGVRAPDLAARLGRDVHAFKRDVRTLKDLGLTESLTTGYHLSPRGLTYRAT